MQWSLTDHHRTHSKLTQLIETASLPQSVEPNAVWPWLTEGKAKRPPDAELPTQHYSVTVNEGGLSLFPLNASYHIWDSDECQRSPAYPVAALGITTELTVSWAPGLHQCAVLVPRIAATLDHVPARRVRGHRNVRDERLILANVVRKHPHYHLEREHDSCEPKARGRHNEAFGVESMGWSKEWCEEQWHTHSTCTTRSGQHAQLHEAQPFMKSRQLLS